MTKSNVKKYMEEYYLKNHNKKNILFSIIIPVYNVEDYLEETINSVVKQTLDFNKHVEIILVNDGSPDNSESICMNYVNSYPENISYYKKVNGGVSSARNLGMKHAKGRFINFLDSDDVLENDTLEKVADFFAKHGTDVDLVCLPIYYFEARKGPHMLNNKFKKTGIIDVNKETDLIQLHVSSTFIKRELALKYGFDERLKYGEDAKYVTSIILNKEKYGVLNTVHYNYRIRKSENSAIQNSRQSKAWYTESLDFFSKELIDLSMNTKGRVIPYIQNIIMYDLQWKMIVKEIPGDVLNEEERFIFIEKFKNILSYIEDLYISSAKYISYDLKLFAHYLKHVKNEDSSFSKIVYKDNIKVFYHDKLYMNMKSQRIYLNLLEIENSTVYIEGMFIGGFEEESSKIFVKLNESFFEAEDVLRPKSDVRVWGQVIKKTKGFKVGIPLNEEGILSSISFWIIQDNVSIQLDYYLTSTMRFSKRIPSYYSDNGWIIYPGKKDLKITTVSFKKLLRKELGMIKRMIKVRKRKSGAKKAIVVRWAYFLIKSLSRKKIYMYMDRIDKADDNAEVLFKYAVENDKSVKHKFILEKSSKDFNRIKKIGDVVAFGSYRHKLYMLLAEKFISSHADEILLNPFKSMKLFYKDLLTYKFVFLQHGVTQNDLSDWLNKYQKNIKLLVTSSRGEYESILNSDYGYTNEDVKLLGMPRHDRLKNSSERNILIMPTWRKKLASALDSNFERVYNPKFIESRYFDFYNKLINSQELLKSLSEYGYKIKFVIHPALKEQTTDFDTNDYVDIVNPDDISYAELFNSSIHLVTDYSSVAFDFVYSRKSISYYQFDRNDFFEEHFAAGYFDYEEMGFGPVIEDEKGMVNYLIDMMKKDFPLEKIYMSRVNNFFEYSDNKNTVRNYNAIRKM